ncbi:hypothetical protein, partial [Geobacillus vulcani]
HHTLAEMGVFDLPFLLAEFPGRPSMVVGDFETFHAEFRSFSMFFIRSSITGVGTAYAKVNFSMSMYIGIEAEVSHTDLTTGQTEKADLYLGARDLVEVLDDGTRNVAKLTNILDLDELKRVLRERL